VRIEHSVTCNNLFSRRFDYFSENVYIMFIPAMLCPGIEFDELGLGEVPEMPPLDGIRKICKTNAM
jgi:hypothetical protein